MARLFDRQDGTERPLPGMTQEFEKCHEDAIDFTSSIQAAMGNRYSPSV